MVTSVLKLFIVVRIFEISNKIE